jgi:hypothetical protein
MSEEENKDVQTLAALFPLVLRKTGEVTLTGEEVYTESLPQGIDIKYDEVNDVFTFVVREHGQ